MKPISRMQNSPEFFILIPQIQIVSLQRNSPKHCSVLQTCAAVIILNCWSSGLFKTNGTHTLYIQNNQLNRQCAFAGCVNFYTMSWLHILLKQLSCKWKSGITVSWSYFGMHNMNWWRIQQFVLYPSLYFPSNKVSLSQLLEMFP